MYKNQLQELAQRSCFNLPSYSCIREGPDHAPRFKATVNFNGETFESPQYCTTLRQAEHSAAEVALNALAGRGPSNSLAARVLDETGVYKNLLQEVSQRVGSYLPAYSTFRSGMGHLPVFTCTVELAGIIFTGEPAKNKKQAEKNAAMTAWTSLKLLVQQFESGAPEKVKSDEQEHVTVARALHKYLVHARMAKVAFPIRFQTQNPRPPTTQQPQPTSSKILPFIRSRPYHSKPFMMSTGNNGSISSQISPQSRPNIATSANETIMSPKASQGQQSTTALDDIILPRTDNTRVRPQRFPAAGAAPYIPIRHFTPHHRFAPPVTIRNAIPVFSSPPPPAAPRMTRPASPVLVRPPVPVLPPPACLEQLPFCLEKMSLSDSTIQVEERPHSKASSVKSKEEVVSKALESPLENPPSSVSVSGNTPSVLLPEKSLNTPPASDVLANPVAQPITNVSVISPSSSANAEILPRSLLTEQPDAKKM